MGANEKQAATYHGAECTPRVRDLQHAYLMASTTSTVVEARREFSRIIEKIKSEAKVEALEEAAGEPELMRGSTAYVSTEWLRARANQYKEAPNA